jgi:hypothetical protein
LATYPFSRASAGFSTGQILTSTAANTIDDNAASGADGALWTDVAIVRNWIGSATFANYGRALIWTDFTGSSVGPCWLSFGVSGGNPLVAYKYATNSAFDIGTVAAGSGLTPLCAAANTTVVVMGGTPGVASASKIRRSVDPITFSAVTTTASGTEGVHGMVWHSGASLFIAGLDNTANTNIETSPDGSTWTQITGLANTNPRGSIATNGTTAVILPYNTSTNKCLSTSNGTTYTERTLPATQVWHKVLWDSVYSRFIAYGASSFAYSSDGATWTAGGAVSLITNVADILGRVIVGGTSTAPQVMAAHLIGTTMTEKLVHLLSPGSADLLAVAAGRQQFMISDTNGVHHWTIAGGGLT